MPRWAWSITSVRVGKVRLASSTLGQPTLAAKHRPPGDPQAVVEIYVSEDGGARVKLRDWRPDPLHAIDEPPVHNTPPSPALPHIHAAQQADGFEVTRCSVWCCKALLLAVCWQVAAHRHRGTGTTALSPGRPRPRTNAPMVHCSPQLDFEGTAQGNERKADEAVLVRRVMRANDNPAPAVIHWV
jgi:hypothetical protein